MDFIALKKLNKADKAFSKIKLVIDNENKLNNKQWLIYNSKNNIKFKFFILIIRNINIDLINGYLFNF